MVRGDESLVKFGSVIVWIEVKYCCETVRRADWQQEDWNQSHKRCSLTIPKMKRYESTIAGVEEVCDETL